MGTMVLSRVITRLRLRWLRPFWRMVPAEPAELIAQRNNFLPRLFRWRGVIWRVRMVQGIWEETRGFGGPRRYFQIVCQDDQPRMLYQDLRIGTWHVSR